VETRLEHAHHAARWKTLLAFAIIYFVWGATFYAIRVGVSEVPPLVFCLMRFVTAGPIVCGWAMVRRERWPRGREWGGVFVLAFLIFVVDYGTLFWAEQRVPSGVAALILATIPAFMALGEILLLRTQKLTLRLGVALLAGICGVGVLMAKPAFLGGLGGTPIDTAGAVAVLMGAISWSLASVLARKLPLPSSKVMSSGAQMLAGGVMMGAIVAARGDWTGFHVTAMTSKAWWALAYLVFAGSIAGFTAYMWLLHHQSPTKVGTYAYVNPVVAVLVGAGLGGESLGARTVVGGLCVLASVAIITTTGAKVREAQTKVEVELAANE